MNISISNPDTTVYCHSIHSYLSVDSGIKKEKRKNVDPESAKPMTYVDSNNLLLKGSQPTRMQYRVMGSFFRDTKDKLFTGAQIISGNATGGSTTDGNEAMIHYGLKAVLEIVPDEQIVQTTWQLRQSNVAQLANLFSTMIAYTGAFGAAVTVVAIILGFDFPIVRYIRNLPFLSTLFADYNEEDDKEEEDETKNNNESSSSIELSSIPDSSITETETSIPQQEETRDETKLDTSDSSISDYPLISDSSSVPETDNYIPQVEEVEDELNSTTESPSSNELSSILDSSPGPETDTSIPQVEEERESYE